MSALHDALSRILIPLARFAIARDLTHPLLADRLKRAYLAAAEAHFSLGGKRLTDSRLHVLTGLQRKDIKALRADSTLPSAPNAGPVARTLGLWQGGEWPDTLPLRGAAPSFDALIGEVSRDVHPRTVQDELVRQGLVTVDQGEIRRLADAFVPATDEAALMGYLGANVGDHAMAAVENVLAAPAPGPNFERAAHYDHLSAEALSELEALSRTLLGDALTQLNARAAELQRADSQNPAARGRFRAGAYVLTRHDTPQEDAMQDDTTRESAT